VAGAKTRIRTPPLAYLVRGWNKIARDCPGESCILRASEREGEWIGEKREGAEWEEQIPEYRLGRANTE